MLERVGTQGRQQIMTMIESKIVLPASLAAFFSEPGYCDSTFFEDRKLLRLRIRCKAVMAIEYSPPSIPRKVPQAIVFVKDISKQGIGIISHQQIWPEEKLLICFHGRRVRATTSRCRRIAEFCWEVGGEITYFKNFEEDEN